MHASSLRVHVVSVFLVQLTCICALAQTTSTPISSTSAAMGGTGRAAVEPIDVHSLNPANLVHLRNRDLHFVGGSRSGLIGLTDNSIDNLFAGALSYSRADRGNEMNEISDEEIRLSFASFVNEKIAVGLTLKQVNTEFGGTTWRQTNSDLGISFVPQERMGLALVFTDLMSSSLESDNPIRLRPRTAVAGHILVNPFIGLRADVVSGPDHDLEKRSLLLGYEGALNEFIALRLGWGQDENLKTEFGTAGFGFKLPRFRLNYAYQTPIRGEFEHRQSLDLGIPF